MHDILPPPPEEARHNRLVLKYSPFDGHSETGRRETQGALHTIKLRVVCQACNNGWMSQLEEEVKPILTPLIKGEEITLDRAQLDTLAQWIAMKVMVGEYNDPTSATTPRPDRIAFRQSRTIPSYMRIYVASHDVPFEKSAGYLRNSQSIARRKGEDVAPVDRLARIRRALQRGIPQPSPPLGDVPNNIQTVTFFLGHIFVHVTSTRVDDFAIEDIALIPKLYDTARIWPEQGSEMTWPRDPKFTLDQVNDIAGLMPKALGAQDYYWARKADQAPTGLPSF
jgi:hypothetical protein